METEHKISKVFFSWNCYFIKMVFSSRSSSKHSHIVFFKICAYNSLALVLSLLILNFINVDLFSILVNFYKFVSLFKEPALIFVDTFCCYFLFHPLCFVFVFVCVCACMSLCVLCVWRCSWRPEGTRPLELELERIVSYYVGAGNWTWVLWKNSQVLLTPESSLQTQ